MTDITLNAALASKLEALRQAWRQDSVAETVTTILDSAMHNWQLPLPPMATVDAKKSVKVRMRARHDAQLAAIASESGLTVAELARMSLVQFLFGGQMATPLPLPPQSTPKQAKVLPLKARLSPNKKQSTPVAATSTPTSDKNSPPVVTFTPVEVIPALTTETSTPVPPTNELSKPKGRQLFADL